MPTRPEENDDEKAGTAGREGRAASVIGVLGAGTMGSGIAQLAARSGARTLLHDPDAEALQRGLAPRARRTRQRSRQGAPRRAGRAGRRRAAARRRRPARARRLRAGDRGCARAHRAQARALPPALGDRRRAVRAREQHLLAARDRDRTRSEPSRARRRDALLQPRADHAPAGGGRRRAVLRACARARARDRRGDGQDGDPRERRPRLPRQPLQPAVWPGGAAASGRADRGRRDDRPHLPHGGRLSHGPVRADGPRRRRRRL